MRERERERAREEQRLSVWLAYLKMDLRGRPMPGEGEEDLLAMQEAFLRSGAPPGATVVGGGGGE